jgi:integrase
MFHFSSTSEPEGRGPGAVLERYRHQGEDHQPRLGHSDIQMTMNIYTYVTKTVKEKTANRFEKFMEL